MEITFTINDVNNLEAVKDRLEDFNCVVCIVNGAIQVTDYAEESYIHRAITAYKRALKGLTYKYTVI